MGLGSERASKYICLGEASWDGAKERHPSVVGDRTGLRGESESVDANSHACYIRVCLSTRTYCIHLIHTKWGDTYSAEEGVMN